MAGRREIKRPARYEDGAEDEAGPAPTKKQLVASLKATATRLWKKHEDENTDETERDFYAALRRLEAEEKGAAAAWLNAAKKKEVRAPRAPKPQEEVIWQPPDAAQFDWSVLKDDTARIQEKHDIAKNQKACG